MIFLSRPVSWMLIGSSAHCKISIANKRCKIYNRCNLQITGDIGVVVSKHVYHLLQIDAHVYGMNYMTAFLLSADKRAANIMIASAQCSNCSFDMKSKACERTAFEICACIPYRQKVKKVDAMPSSRILIT